MAKRRSKPPKIETDLDLGGIKYDPPSTTKSGVRLPGVLKLAVSHDGDKVDAIAAFTTKVLGSRITVQLLTDLEPVEEKPAEWQGIGYMRAVGWDEPKDDKGPAIHAALVFYDSADGQDLPALFALRCRMGEDLLRTASARLTQIQPELDFDGDGAEEPAA